MSVDILLALIVFAFVSTVTPGPNNLMVMTSGVNFGFRRTLPHIMGIAGGFCFLVLAVGFGLGAIIHAYPAVQVVMKTASAAYLAYLAWRIAFSRAMGEARRGEGRPMTFLQAAAFQWVNPKAWAMALVAIGAYVSAEAPVASVLIVAGAFALVTFPCVSIWTAFGTGLRGFLAQPKRLRAFNIAMGLLLLATIWPLLAN